MTSNLGSDILLDGIENGEIREDARQQIDTLLKRSFRPEFLNRIDETVCYKPLSADEISQIADLQLNALAKRLAERQLKLETTEAAKKLIADKGYDPIFGARPLKRYLQSAVETAIAKCILMQDPSPDSTIVLDAQDEEIIASIR